MRRSLRRAAMRRGLPGRMHPRRPGADRNAAAAARQIPPAHRQGNDVKTFVLATALACAPLAFAPLAAHAADAAKPGHAAIASAHKLATEAGFEVLGQGGNAFDAAVAVAAALSVVEPQSSGIGGGGLFLLHRASDGENVMIDARETAPAATDPKDYLDANGNLDQNKSWNGPSAAAIPGEPAGLVWLAQHYGKLPLKASLAPAIRIARE